MAGWILGLETSGRGGSVAISDGIEEYSIDLREVESDAGLGVGEESGSAKFLAPAIESLMERYRRDMADLRAIAVTVGPGSFTGIRVGIATAKGLAYALRIPTIAIDSLECIAERYSSDDSSQLAAEPDACYWTLMDAYRGELFVRRWSCQQGRLQSLSASYLQERGVWWESLAEARESSSTHYCLGPGANRLGEYTFVDASSSIRLELRPEVLPRALEVARIGSRLFEEGKTVDPFRLEPVYLRRSAAEEKRDRT